MCCWLPFTVVFLFWSFRCSQCSPTGFTSCYVSNYSCVLSRHQEHGGHRNILTCTTTQLHACFPAFGHPNVRLRNSSMGRISDMDHHTFPYHHIHTLNLHADLTQIPALALRYFTSLESLTIDRGPKSRDLLQIYIHSDAFDRAESLRAIAFRHVDFSTPRKRRRRNAVWAKAPGPAMRKAEVLKRLTFDRCQFDRLDKHFFGDQYVMELTLTNCVILEGGGFSNDALDGYKQSLDQLIIKDTSLPSFPHAVGRLKSLMKLVLSGCNLKYIPDDAFAPSTSSNLADSLSSSNRLLQELDFSFNRLETIGPKALRTLVDLVQLNLEGNPNLASLPPGLFLENRRLKSISLRDCTRLRSLTMQELRGLENSLMRLSLRNCRSLNILRVNKLNRLRELDAHACGIENLTKGMFGRHRFTEGEFSLDGNPIAQIEEGALEGVDLPRAWSLRNTHLKILDLSTAFFGVGSLTRLELKRNSKLTNITVSDPKKVAPTLREIKLGENGDFRLSDWEAMLRRFLLQRKEAKFILEGAALCSCEWDWMKQVKENIDFQDGGDGDHWWTSLSYSEDKAYCCNAIVRKSSNDTSPLYAGSFLTDFNQYCQGEAPNKDRLLQSCISNSASSVSENYWSTAAAAILLLFQILP